MAPKKRIEILNRKAGFNFHIEEKFDAGIVLLGTEVKSIRANNVNLGDAYCFINEGEMFITNMHISEFKQASFATHDPLRQRKLLLNKKELNKISLKVKSKGYTIFPIKLFESEDGIFKMEIGLGQGKKTFDKREDIKEKDAKRDLERFRK